MIDFGDIEVSEASHAQEFLAADWAFRAERSASARRCTAASRKPQVGGSDKKGIFYELVLPTCAEEIDTVGATWLNQAFAAAGSLPKGTKVSSLRALKRLGSLGTVTKLLLDVEWAPRKGPLHQLLLVKLCSAESHQQEELTLASMPPCPVRPLQPDDWVAEINAYRLLEGNNQLGMPRFYFGDVCADSSTFILVTQWVPTTEEGDWEAWLPGINRLDIQSATFEFWFHFVRESAALAGSLRAGKPGHPELQPNLFQEAAPQAGAVDPAEADDWLGVGDTDWAVRAAMLQDFVSNVGRRLFPTYARSDTAMKGLRKCLLAGRNNATELAWWLRLRPEFVGLGVERLDIDSIYELELELPGRGERPLICLRTWEGFSEGNLVQKLLRWLTCARPEVVQLHLFDLLQIFAETYADFGGPPLDMALMRSQLCIAMLAQCSQLVDQMERLYRWLPKDQWTSVKGINDQRLCRRASQHGSLWRFVRCFVNVVIMVQQLNLGRVIEDLMPEVLTEHGVGMPMSADAPPLCYAVFRDGAELHAEPSKRATLVSYLSKNMLMYAANPLASKPDADRPKITWVEVHVPVPGWILERDIRQREPPPFPLGGELPPPLVDDLSVALCNLFGLMHHTRRQYTGSNPQGTCITSAMLLRTEVLTRDRSTQFLKSLGRGPCGVYLGSFLAERTRRPWWPSGYQDWMHHSFLVFEDGSIADITADQFDKVPQLWFPADRSRYSLDCQKADEALKVREAFGLDRWQVLVQNDDTVVAKTRLKWTEATQRVERQQEKQQEQLQQQQQQQQPRSAGRRLAAGEEDHPATCAKVYHFVGDSNGWKLPPHPMALRAASQGKGELVHRVVLGQKSKQNVFLGPSTGREQFQILRDGSWDKRIFPDTRGAALQAALLYAGGPSAKAKSGTGEQGHGKNWAVEGQVGDVIDVVFDPVERVVWLEDVP